MQWLKLLLSKSEIAGSNPTLAFKFRRNKCFFPAHSYMLNIEENLCDQELAYSASDCQGSNSESCVWRVVSSHSCHHPQGVLVSQFSLYVHIGGLKSRSFFHFLTPKVDPRTERIKIFKWQYTYTTGIQMKRKELTKIFMMISMLYLKLKNQRFKGCSYRPLYVCFWFYPYPSCLYLYNQRGAFWVQMCPAVRTQWTI